MHMLSYAPVSPVLFKKGLPLTHKESIVINCRKIWFGGSLHQSRLLDSTISNYLVFSYNIYGLIISCSVNLFLLFTIYLIYLKKVNLTFNCRVYWNTLYLYPVLLSEEGGGVQNSSTSNHRHPNVFCGERASQLVISQNKRNIKSVIS